MVLRYDKWKKNLIKKRIQTLENIKTSKTNSDLITMIDDIKNIYELISRKQGTFLDYTCLELLTDNFSLMSEYDFLWDIFKCFSFYNNVLMDYPYEEIKTNFSNQDILDLTYEFYKNATDKEIFSTFEKLFDKSNICFFEHSNVRFAADTLYLPYYKEMFTQIKTYGDVTDLSNLVHEFGHGIHLYNNYDKNVYKMNGILLEVVSTFFEDICLHYYGNTGDFQKASNVGLIELFELCKEDIVAVDEIINIYKCLDIDSNTNKKLVDYRINKFLEDKDSRYLVNCLLLENPHVSACYIIAKLISIELFNIYLNDPDKAFYLLKKIMMIDLRMNLKDYYQEIVNLGLVAGSSTLEYNDYLKKKLVRIKK